jgi:hypothetical protein
MPCLPALAIDRLDIVRRLRFQREQMPPLGLLRLALLTVVFGSLCLGQTFGTVTGEVKDNSGANVAGAQVTIRNTSTNASRTDQTNSDGLYVFPSLAPGSYEVTVEARGFKTETRTNIDLQVQQTARLDFTLEIGQLNQTVEVSAAAAQLTTENATVGTVIEHRRIVDLPLNGRDFMQLIALSPNVTTGFGSPQIAANREGGTRATENFSISGQRSTANNYTLDGIENTDVNFNLYIFLPSIDALQEFKIQSGVYPAEFGRELGQVNVSTVSGTNQYHGALFEFLRNNITDANQYAFTATPTSREPFKWNQYGFTLGGPLSIPKLFNGKDKLFFMTNFEGFNIRQQVVSLYNVPTAAMRNGDFSSLLSRGNQLYYPFGRTVGPNGVVNAVPIPGDRIPSSQLSPQSLQMLQYEPLPNQATTGISNNYLANDSEPTNKDQFTARIDWNQNAKSTWFGRYSWTSEDSIIPTIGGAGSRLDTNAQQWELSNTFVLSPTKVNEFRFGVNKFYNDIGPLLAGVTCVVCQLGLPGLSSSNSAVWGIPQIRNVPGFSGWGDDTNGPYVLQDAIFQWIDNFSYIVGKHSLRFGGELRRDRYNQLGNEFARGAFSFSGIQTANPNTLQGGYGMAAFMLGAPSQVDGAVGLAFEQMRGSSGAVYLDDTYRVTPTLTLSLGLRYELTPPFYDKSQHETNLQMPFFGSFANVTAVAPNLQPVEVRSGTNNNYYQGLPLFFPNVPVARDGRLGSRMYPTDYMDFAPRIGVAWSPSSKWTFRTGAGIFYVQDSNNSRFDLARALGGHFSFPASSTLPTFNWTNYLTPGATVSIKNPYLYGVANDLVNPRVLQYIANVQHELSDSTMIEVGYEGSVGNHLEGLYNFNEATPSPFGSVASRAPFPNYGILQVVQDGDNSNYNSLSLKLQRRFSSGLTLQGSYTWSKSLDDASAIRGQSDTIFPQNSRCLSCEYALSAFNVPQRFVLSVVYDLPFGPGKPFVNSGGILDKVVGGWELSGIYLVQSGTPGYPTAGVDQSNTGIGNSRDRLNATGVSPSLNNPTTEEWFNTAAFTLEPYGTFGNAGRNTIPNPGRNAANLTMLKNFRIRERATLQVRWEVYNAFNHPNWGNPGNIWGTNFGVISSIAGDTPMRQMQFGLKLLF